MYRDLPSENSVPASLMNVPPIDTSAVASIPALDRITSKLENHPESHSFLRTALSWQGSVTPAVFPRVLTVSVYGGLVAVLALYVDHIAIPITPFEYSGAVLGLLLVLRINSGMDRWWEARKLWGQIVNQSRNLALVTRCYGSASQELTTSLLQWIAVWPYIMKSHLRGEFSHREISSLVGSDEAVAIANAAHPPSYVAFKIARMLKRLRIYGFDDMSFLRAETERSQLIDAIGACERIKGTRMPLALAIKTRRFILLFLLLLPLALVDRVGFWTPLVVALTAYPLFSLDEIGAELQNPFSRRNLSHLPLDKICKTIEKSVMSLKNIEPHAASNIELS